MEWLYISVSVVGIIIFIASIFLLTSKGKKTLVNLIIMIFSVVMLVLSALVFLIG